MYKILVIILVLLFLCMNLKMSDNIVIVASLVILLLLYSLFLNKHYDRFSSSLVVESSVPFIPNKKCYTCIP